uniref:Uncharacterized protein n=1 Tax=Fagus sylvatica TaxID=28930 RepID=A0A2N9J3G7_FAGSY
MGYIGAHGVTALHRYKYSGVDHSYLAKYVLQPFWSRFVHFFPLWMPVESRGEREREDIPQDQGGKDGQDHEARGSAEHKLTLVSLHYKGIPLGNKLGGVVIDGVGVRFAHRSRRGGWVARRSLPLPLPLCLPLSLSFTMPSHRAQPKRGERQVAVDLAVDLVVDLVVGYGGLCRLGLDLRWLNSCGGVFVGLWWPVMGCVGFVVVDS